MNDTEIKTRHGLILQGVLAFSLKEAGFDFAQDHQYDETCEVPDFLIPDEINPKIMIEVHQTDTRDSFRMKILRAFTAVCEAKAHYGIDLISVNVLFGDPERELPPSNVQAMCGIFDVNLVPRAGGSSKTIVSLEHEALKLAADEKYNTQEAIRQIVRNEIAAVKVLAGIIKSELKRAKPKEHLALLWKMECKRLSSLTAPPTAGNPTYAKRCMLWSLFFYDADFGELFRLKDPDKCSASLKKQLIVTKLAELSEDLDGDHLILNSFFASFIKDPDAPRLRLLCSTQLASSPAMKFFFDDIREAKRRDDMVTAYKAFVKKGTVLE